MRRTRVDSEAGKIALRAARAVPELPIPTPNSSEFAPHCWRKQVIKMTISQRSPPCAPVTVTSIEPLQQIKKLDKLSCLRFGRSCPYFSALGTAFSS